MFRQDAASSGVCCSWWRHALRATGRRAPRGTTVVVTGRGLLDAALLFSHRGTLRLSPPSPQATHAIALTQRRVFAALRRSRRTPNYCPLRSVPFAYVA